MANRRDKFLTKAMGKIWHEINYIGCSCGEELDSRKYTHEIADFYKMHSNTNLSTWAGFGELWEWAQKQEWFSLFLDTFFFIDSTNGLNALVHHIHPNRFADAIYDFLNEVQ
jgi:hypothetical protein